MEIITNRQWREILYWWDLTEEEFRIGQLEEAQKYHDLLEKLVSVINEDKEGGFFICEEARHIIEEAVRAIRV